MLISFCRAYQPYQNMIFKRPVTWICRILGWSAEWIRFF